MKINIITGAARGWDDSREYSGTPLVATASYRTDLRAPPPGKVKIQGCLGGNDIHSDGGFPQPADFSSTQRGHHA